MHRKVSHFPSASPKVYCRILPNVHGPRRHDSVTVFWVFYICKKSIWKNTDLSVDEVPLRAETFEPGTYMNLTAGSCAYRLATPHLIWPCSEPALQPLIIPVYVVHFFMRLVGNTNIQENLKVLCQTNSIFIWECEGGGGCHTLLDYTFYKNIKIEERKSFCPCYTFVKERFVIVE